MNIRSVQRRKRYHRLSLIALTRLITVLMAITPFRLGVRLGGVLGFLAYYLLPRERKLATAHLTSAFTDRDPAWIRRVAQRSFVHLGKGLFETILMRPERLSRIVEFRGYENLVRAHEQGRGVVFVTGHIGNWELLAAAVSAAFPVSVVAAPLKPEEMNDMVLGLRSRMGVRTILRDRPGASRELIRVFKENRYLGILIDQDTDVDGAFVDFMGRPAWTPTAAAQMALKFQAPVLYGHIHRRNDGRHTITVEGPLELIRTGDAEGDVIANTARFTKMIEASVLQAPEQWVWMHRRWRRQP